MKKLLIVGDNFTDLLTYSSVVSYVQLAQNPALVTRETQLVYGQGVMHACLDKLLNINPLPSWLHCSPTDRLILGDYPSRNHLLSNLKKNTEISFTSWLSIDNDHDELQDHTTGIHLNGMLLLMAAQQFAEAVCTSYLPPFKTSTSSGIAIDFLRYAFPLKTKIIGKLDTQSGSTSLLIEFWQGPILTTKASYPYSPI